MKIFAVIYDKVPNTTTGIMNWRMEIVGYPYDVPGKGEFTLERIEESVGKNSKPIVVLYYSGGIVKTIPDYNVDKFHIDEEQERQKTDNRTTKH